MKIQYDAEVDALYIEFCPLEPSSAENRELSEDVIANYALDGTLSGLEIMNASAVLGEQLNKVIVEVTPARHLAA